jgi:hypothetical protein
MTSTPHKGTDLRSYLEPRLHNDDKEAAERVAAITHDHAHKDSHTRLTLHLTIPWIVITTIAFLAVTQL